MIYYIADLHLGHENIIRLNHRPFKNADDMQDTIIRNWNNIVTDNDTVYVLGDVAYRGDVEKAVKTLNMLKGTKILLVGNHDSKALKSANFRAAFQRIENILEITDGSERVVLCHYPIMEWNGYFRGAWHVFGHVHNNTGNPSFKYICNESRALNAGVDITGFKPATLAELKVLNANFKSVNK